MCRGRSALCTVNNTWDSRSSVTSDQPSLCTTIASAYFGVYIYMPYVQSRDVRRHVKQRQNVRCQVCLAECSTLKPCRLVSVEACQGKAAVCRGVNMLSLDIFGAKVACCLPLTCRLSSSPLPPPSISLPSLRLYIRVRVFCVCSLVCLFVCLFVCSYV